MYTHAKQHEVLLKGSTLVDHLLTGALDPHRLLRIQPSMAVHAVTKASVRGSFLASRALFTFTPSIIETFRQLPSRAYIPTSLPPKTYFSTSRSHKLTRSKPFLPPQPRHKSSTSAMATELSKQVVKEGNKTDKPQKGDTVTIEYTGWLYDPNAANKRGSQ